MLRVMVFLWQMGQQSRNLASRGGKPQGILIFYAQSRQSSCQQISSSRLLDYFLQFKQSELILYIRTFIQSSQRWIFANLGDQTQSKFIIYEFPFIRILQRLQVCWLWSYIELQVVIKLMQKSINKQQIIDKSKDFYRNLIKQAKPQPFHLNVSLTSNPFLKDRDAFKFIRFQLTEYNKRIDKGQVHDSYEILSFQKLHSLLSDIAEIDTRQDQVTALQQLSVWQKQQQRLIQQRHDQGSIRYSMSKQYRDALRVVPDNKVEQQQPELQIPFYLIERILQPYRNNWRSLHSQLQNPSKRLKQYKKKSIKIAIFGDNKEEVKPPRVLYPVPPKYEPKQEEPEQKPAEAAQDTNPPQPADPQAPAVEGQPVENKQQNPPNEAQPDMGGFGEEPEQPEEEQPPEQMPDKLKPKHPIYSEAIQQDNQKKYKQGYQFYLGNESKQERRMQLRYMRKYHDSLRKQREDAMQIDIAHEWAKKKSTITKDMQKRLEQMKLKPSYLTSKQPAPVEQRIGLQDQLRFGFTTMARNKPRINNEVELSYNELPPINQTFDEKSIRRDRLNSLKSKFGKLLNLGEQQERESAPSLCQYSSRRRGLSEIIRNHSQSKQRLNQLQQISEIKDRLTKVKININIKALSRGLVLPENEEYFATTERQYPGKDLPSNPNMIETKKKKKKK